MQGHAAWGAGNNRRPGTGKTTTLNCIIDLFEQEGMEVELAAYRQGSQKNDRNYRPGSQNHPPPAGIRLWG